MAGDRINLHEVTQITGYWDLTQNHLTQVGSNAVFQADGLTRTLTGVNINDLTESDLAV